MIVYKMKKEPYSNHFEPDSLASYAVSIALIILVVNRIFVIIENFVNMSQQRKLMDRKILYYSQKFYAKMNL